MEVVGSWCNSSHGDSGYSRRLWESESDRYVLFNLPKTGSKVPVWRLLWRKIKKEKRKIFDCSTAVQFTYDPYTYSQNFDEGVTCRDSDDLSRSFSARFAVPSRVFEKSTTGLMDQ